MHIERLTRLDLAKIQTLIFAGGGNRCWWQAGVLTHWLNQGLQLPLQLVGTSAGAAVAAACLTTDGTQVALDACLRLYNGNARMLDWHGLTRFKPRFAHQHIYPSWLSSFVNAQTFDTLCKVPSKLRVAFTRPARWLGLGGSVVIGTLAYLVDKYSGSRLHPGLPRMLGLHQEFLEPQACTSVAEAQNLLVAAAAAPPFLSAQRIGGAHAIDGGYFDNAPIPPQMDVERNGTLILLTRHYPKLPTLFRCLGRNYLQPSQRVPVSTWDCTMRATVREAFALGQLDATRSMADQTFIL
jgi:predicted acylesterase/phospholipase RssA